MMRSKNSLECIIKSLPTWLMIIPLAVLNGALRDFALHPLLGWYALPASGVLLCGMILLLAWLRVARFVRGGSRQLVLAGVVWAVLAVIFECLLGIALNRQWVDLAAAYDVSSGNLWLLVVVCVGCAPWLAARMRGIVQGAGS